MEFDLLKMKDSDSVKEYFFKLMDIVNQIRILGENFPDHKVVEKIMQQKEGKKVSVDHSGEVKSDGYQDKSSRRGKFSSCGICKKTNHLEKNYWQKSKRSPIQCRYCKKYGHIEKYCSLDKSDGTKVKLGDGALVQAQGRGLVKFPTDEGMKNINDVFLLPNLTQNLLSVAQLLYNNYSLNFKDKKYVIYDPKDCEVAKISMIGNSFPISCYSAGSCSFNVEMSDTWLWHKRFGHYNLSSLVGKVQVFSTFKEFKAVVERESGCRLKYIRSDNEIEYTSHWFSKYCKDVGI
ncbi:uncharacterized protein LOC124897581 [Capsicum annuum]|uniref:uncharacterized protein LOC124897581 n=1 Tax=Capsicum annuum TaxID=4072 RepID=UPI001FB0F211|nr:uncharacterized protein LOC124897581 [Capsicum annuum]